MRVGPAGDVAAPNRQRFGAAGGNPLRSNCPDQWLCPAKFPEQSSCVEHAQTLVGIAFNFQSQKIGEEFLRIVEVFRKTLPKEFGTAAAAAFSSCLSMRQYVHVCDVCDVLCVCVREMCVCVWVCVCVSESVARNCFGGTSSERSWPEIVF